MQRYVQCSTEQRSNSSWNFPVVTQRLFKCLDCQQYVVFLSHSPPATQIGYGITTADLSYPDPVIPEHLNFSQQLVLDDLCPFQISTSDPDSNSFSFSVDLHGPCQPDSLPFPTSDMPQIPYSQVIDVPMADTGLDLYDPYYLVSAVDTNTQTDVTALLEKDVQELRDVVYGLKERYVPFIIIFDKSSDSLLSYVAYDACSFSNFDSLTRHRTQRQTDLQIESIRSC